MADHYEHPKCQETLSNKEVPAEARGCGVFGCLKVKDDKKPEEYVGITDVEMAKEEEEKHTPKQQLHSSRSHSSSSSDEEDENGERKKKKKKGLKENIKEKISGEKEEEYYKIPVEMGNGTASNTADHADGWDHEKKGFIEKITEKLPGHHDKKNDYRDQQGRVYADHQHAEHNHEVDAKEKKGILEKIKDKLPGGHKNEDDKDKQT